MIPCKRRKQSKKTDASIKFTTNSSRKTPISSSDELTPAKEGGQTMNGSDTCAKESINKQQATRNEKTGQCVQGGDLREFSPELSASSEQGLNTPLEIPKITDPSLAGRLDLQGISVYCLRETFLNDVRNFGLDEKSNFYEIENLRGPEGVVRTKGKDKICPIDKKPGAAYVHCLQGDDNVGDATHMLSWTWGYTAGDVIDTLEDYCSSYRLDPKHTYIWICCLCVNQHRVIEMQNSGMLDQSAVDFEAEFRARVLGVGRVLCMMAPWDNPFYLKRVWCIFEIFTAMYAGEVEITIVMPPEEKEKMVQELVDGEGKGIDALYEALGKTRVQDGGAYSEVDSKKILSMIEDNAGYEATNVSVNEYLREWVQSVIDDLVEEFEEEDSTNVTNEREQKEKYSYFCNQVGTLLWRNGEHNASITLFSKSLVIDKEILGDDHPDVAAVHNNIGRVYVDMGRYDEALHEYDKALDIYCSAKSVGADHLYTATTHHNIGLAYHSKGECDRAEQEFKRALEIRKKRLGDRHTDLAESYNNIGLILLGKTKYDLALKEFKKALIIYKQVVGKVNPSTATTYSYIGDGLYEKGEYEQALEAYRECLSIEELLYGRNHHDTATTRNNIGLALADMGNHDAALVEYRAALDIFIKSCGENHSDTGAAHNNIADEYVVMGKFDEALSEYQKARTIFQTAWGEENPYTATSHNNIGSVHKAKGDFVAALEEYEKALAIKKIVNGDCHPDTATVYHNIGELKSIIGNYGEALKDDHRALTIREEFLGKDHPLTASTYSNIGVVYYKQQKYDDALEMLSKALSVFASTLGKDHSTTSSTRALIEKVRQSISKKSNG